MRRNEAIQADSGQPTLFLTNNFDETGRQVIVRYAGRNRIEDGLGISVNFFHLDCLAGCLRRVFCV